VAGVKFQHLYYKRCMILNVIYGNEYNRLEVRSNRLLLDNGLH